MPPLTNQQATEILKATKIRDTNIQNGDVKGALRKIDAVARNAIDHGSGSIEAVKKNLQRLEGMRERRDIGVQESADIQTIIERIRKMLENGSCNEGVSETEANVYREDPEEDEIMETATEERNGIVFRSEAMREVVEQAEYLALSELPVLIVGETGTGKELIARMLHEKGPRKGKPFVAINCAAIPETLIESELFGYTRGAFTGAEKDKEGLLEAVGMGTLFLDEIGEMPPSTQAKILRTLQERKFRPVGGRNGEKEFMGRIVTATNRNLLNDPGFRKDLLHRIATTIIAIPALREREEDIEVIAREILKRRDPAWDFSKEALEKMEKLYFPGNVRELEGLVARAHLEAQRGKTSEKIIHDHNIKPIEDIFGSIFHAKE